MHKIHRHAGFLTLALMCILSVGALFWLSMSWLQQREHYRTVQHADTLGTARQAVLEYALSGLSFDSGVCLADTSSQTLPGRLPRPDTLGNGVLDGCGDYRRAEGGALNKLSVFCPLIAGQHVCIGQFPWRRFEMAPPTRTLWYAAAAGLIDPPSLAQGTFTAQRLQALSSKYAWLSDGRWVQNIAAVLLETEAVSFSSEPDMARWLTDNLVLPGGGISVMPPIPRVAPTKRLLSYITREELTFALAQRQVQQLMQWLVGRPLPVDLPAFRARLPEKEKALLPWVDTASYRVLAPDRAELIFAGCAAHFGLLSTATSVLLQAEEARC